MYKLHKQCTNLASNASSNVSRYLAITTENAHSIIFSVFLYQTKSMSSFIIDGNHFRSYKKFTLARKAKYLRRTREPSAPKQNSNFLYFYALNHMNYTNAIFFTYWFKRFKLLIFIPNRSWIEVFLIKKILGLYTMYYIDIKYISTFFL